MSHACKNACPAEKAALCRIRQAQMAALRPDTTIVTPPAPARASFATQLVIIGNSVGR